MFNNKYFNFIKHFFFLTSGYYIQKIFLLSLTIIAANILKVKLFGILSIAISLSTIISVVSNAGLQSYMLIEGIKNTENISEYFSKIYYTKFFLAILNIIILILGLYILKYSKIIWILSFLFTLNYILSSFIEINYSFFKSYSENKYISITSIISGVVTFVFGYTLLIIYRNILIIPLAFLLGKIIGLIISLFYFNKIFKLKLIFYKLDSNYKYFLKKAFPYVIGYIFIYTYGKIDIIMLSKMVGEKSVGIYSAAYNIISALMFVPIFAVEVLLPKIFKQLKKDKKNILKNSIFLFIISVITIIILYFFSGIIFRLIYSNEYTNSIKTFKILLLYLSALSLAALYSHYFRIKNKLWLVAFIYFSGLVFNVVLNLYLIPKFNYNGASVATVIGEFLIVLMFLISFKIKKVDNNEFK